MSKLIIYRGLPGSGKTTNAKTRQAVHGGTLAGRDHIRGLLFGRPGEMLSYAQENRVTQVQVDLIREGLRNGEIVYVDDLNLRQRYVRRLLQIANEEGAEFEVIDLTYVDLEECIIGDYAPHRPYRVGEEAILDLHERFIKGRPYPLPMPQLNLPQDIQPYVEQNNREYIVLVDLDGTLAHKGDRDIYDGSRAYVDSVDRAVGLAVALYQNAGFKPIFMSGRDDTWHLETERWLEEKAWFTAKLGDNLFMRPGGDQRPDSIVKYELFDKYVRPYYNVEVVFDDRNSVVKMWRDLGLKVFQVQDGDF